MCLILGPLLELLLHLHNLYLTNPPPVAKICSTLLKSQFMSCNIVRYTQKHGQTTYRADSKSNKHSPRDRQRQTDTQTEIHTDRHTETKMKKTQ